MIAQLYLLTMAIIAIVAIMRPAVGLYIAVLLLLCNPSIFISEQVEMFRPMVLLWVILFFSTLARGYTHGESSKIFTILAVLFFWFAVVSTLFSGQFALYKNTILANYFKAVLVSYILIGYINKEEQMENLIRIAVLGAALNAILGVAEYFFPIIPSRGEGFAYYRSAGFEGDANYYSANLVSIVPFAHYMYTHEKVKYLRYFGLATVGMTIAGVFCSVSRGGLAALVVVLGILFIKNKKNLPLFILIAVFVGGFLFFAKDLYQKRETVKTRRSGETVLDGSTSARLSYIQNYLTLCAYNPIFGVGANQLVAEGSEQLGISKKKLSRSAHNAFLHLLAENGIIGFSLFMGILVLSFKAAGRMRLKQGYYAELAAPMRLCLFTWLVSCFGGVHQQVAFFWVCLSLPIILDKIYDQNEQPVKKPGGARIAARV